MKELLSISAVSLLVYLIMNDPEGSAPRLSSTVLDGFSSNSAKAR